MRWLQRHSWWVLVLLAATFIAFGVTDMALGGSADEGIPQGLTGMGTVQLEAEGPAAYRMFDFLSRVNGWSLVLAGTLLAIVLLVPFRRNERWAWLTLWLLPAWSAGVVVFYLVAGVQADQPPPPPMVSGPVVTVVAAAVLLLSAPRFFARTEG